MKPTAHGRSPGSAEAVDEGPRPAGERDRQPDGGRGADRAVHRHVAPGYERDREATRRRSPRGLRPPRCRHPRGSPPPPPGTRAEGRGLRSRSICAATAYRKSVKSHFSGVVASRAATQEPAKVPARIPWRVTPADDRPVHRAAPVVRAEARDRGEDDARQRGAERQVHQASRPGSPAASNERASIGTMTSPPPTPSSPASPSRRRRRRRGSRGRPWPCAAHFHGAPRARQASDPQHQIRAYAPISLLPAAPPRC